MAILKAARGVYAKANAATEYIRTLHTKEPVTIICDDVGKGVVGRESIDCLYLSASLI